MAEKLQIDITATDDASKVVDPLAVKVGKLETSDPTVAVDADTASATKSLDGVEADAKALDKLSPEVHVDADVRDGERAIDKFDKELEALTKSGRELRIEFRQEVLEGKISTILRQLEGLDDPVEIEAKTQQLDTAIGDLKDLKELAERKYEVEVDVDPKRNAKRAADDLEGMRGRADGLQSALPALRGFTDEMGSTAAGAGIAGQALGDLGDFSLILGEKFGISEKAMAGLGTAMGGLGLGVVAVGLAVTGIQALWKRFGESATQDLTKVTDAQKKLNAAVKDGKLDEAAQSFTDAYGKFLPVIHRAGISTQEFVDILAGSGVRSEEVQAKLAKHRDELGNYTGTSKAASEAIAQAADQWDRTNKSLGTSGSQLADVKTALGGIYPGLVETASANADVATTGATVNDVLAEQRERLEEVAQGYDDTQAAQEAMIDGAENAADSQRAANETYAEFGKVVGDATSTSKQATDAAIAFAKAQEKAKDDSSAASGQIRTNTEKVDSLNGSLLATAGASATGRAEIVAYIGQLNGIPADKQTEIQALLDQGKVEEAKRVLDAASSTRTVAVSADASQFYSDMATARAEASKPVTVPVKYRDDQRYGAHASGGTVQGWEDRQIVGEQGPEIVDLPPGTRVHTAAQTRSMLAGPRGGGGDTYVTVNTHAGMSAQDVVTEQRRWARRNGRDS